MDGGRGVVAKAGLEHPGSRDNSDFPHAISISGLGKGKMETASRGQEFPLEFLESPACPGRELL